MPIHVFTILHNRCVAGHQHSQQTGFRSIIAIAHLCNIVWYDGDDDDDDVVVVDDDEKVENEDEEEEEEDQ